MRPAKASDIETQLIDDIGGFTHDPLGFVRYAFDWGHGELEKHKGPRAWQADILDVIGTHLRNTATRFQPLRIAVASGHGIGKSALISQIIQWGISTCEDTKVLITANTEPQLRTKTWPEVRKWARLAINAHWFSPTATALTSKDPGHETTWRADAVTWSEHNTEAFAGLHNQGKRIIVIFDEASNIADKVWEVTKGALTDEDTEIIWLAFGNPTRNSGAFKDCFTGKERKLWVTRQIDSRTVEGTNKAYLQEMVDTYGEDSDVVKVRVRGMFPSLSMKQFIATADVDAAFGKHLRADQYNFAPVIISCDPAWSGDDELVIAKRQGLAFTVLETLPKNDNDVLIANKIARYEDEHQADAVFIDGGYGTGIVSAARTMGRDWTIVWFSESSNDPGCVNKRAEMWNAVRKWLKEGGAIPEDQVLYNDLVAPETVPRLDGKIQLESKEQMKKRGVPSPNRADALCLTFAQPVVKKYQGGYSGTTSARTDYDPYASA